MQLNRIPRRGALLLLIAMLMLTGIFQGQPTSAQTTNSPASPNDYSFSNEIVLSNAQTALYPRVAMNATDTAAFYSLGDTNVEFGYWATSPDYGRSWPNRARLTDSSGSLKGTSGLGVDVDSAGNIYFAWPDYAYSPRSLAFRKYNVSTGSFEPIRRLNSINTNGVDLAVGPDGSIHIVYVNVLVSGSRGLVQYIKSTNGGQNFSAPVSLSDGRNWVPITTIAVDTAGRAHVAWAQGDGVYTNDVVNGAWSGQVRREEGRTYWPRLAQDNNGGVGLVWQTNFGGQAEIFLLRWSGATQSWDPVPTNFSSTPDSSFYPAIAFDRVGSAYVTWSENNGGGTEVLFFSYELSPRSPNLSNIQRIENERTTNSDIASWNNNFVLAYSTTQYSSSWRVYGRYLTAGPVPTSTPVGSPTPAPTATSCSGTTFRDVCQNYWAYGFIEGLASRGVIQGSNGYFYPDTPASRGAFSKFVVNSMGWPLVTGAQRFTDVPTTHPFYPYIETAAQRGAINGYTDPAQCPTGAPCFNPDRNVKRGDAALVIKRANNFPTYTPATGQTFQDVPRTLYTFEAIETLNHLNILGGASCTVGVPTPICFRPDASTKRSEMSKIIYNTYPFIQTYSPNSAAPGGRAVTIIGHQFGDVQGTGTLTVNNTPVNIISWSDEAITFNLAVGTPPGTNATVTLIVNNKRAFISSSATFTVLAPGTPEPAP